MTRFSRTPQRTARARSLRRSMTAPEVSLWQYLRREGLGVPFRKQHPFGAYVLDFYCAPLKLAIELDGSQHIERADHDARRTAFLNEHGVEVLRFWNNDVMQKIDGVGQVIIEAIRRRSADLSN
ncbi:MAG: DUF559 domain-containing protein [Alphaproteobacteria bacterium]|nr:DUF559 domain-containing protein [Alphaproteobacteria bacterium]